MSDGALKFQFQLDGRGFGSPLRDTWKEAAQDAVNAGYAVWDQSGDSDGVKLDAGQGAAIAKVDPDAAPRNYYDPYPRRMPIDYMRIACSRLAWIEVILLIIALLLALEVFYP